MSLTEIWGKGPVKWAALAATVGLVVGAASMGAAGARLLDTERRQAAAHTTAQVQSVRAEIREEQRETLRRYVTREELAEKVLPMRIDVAEIKALLREQRRR
ncbi:MAG TPA: hypothetical protein VD930_09750 [Gemmatimonadales bacterium]|nr:hypothetical protein [Gemmatimonadales bacterium]